MFNHLNIVVSYTREMFRQLSKALKLKEMLF